MIWNVKINAFKHSEIVPCPYKKFLRFMMKFNVVHWKFSKQLGEPCSSWPRATRPDTSSIHPSCLEACSRETHGHIPGTWSTGLPWHAHGRGSLPTPPLAYRARPSSECPPRLNGPPQSAHCRSVCTGFLGVSPRDAGCGLQKIPIFFEAGWESSLFWISTPLYRRHSWVLSIPLNTSIDSLTLSFTWPGLFLSIPCWMTLRALANFSIFSLCFLWSWGTFFHLTAPGEAPKSTFPTVLSIKSINLFTSASCVEERVGIVENWCTFGLKSYPSSLRTKLRLAGPGIHGQTGLVRSNTGSNTCVRYALSDQGIEIL